MTISESTHRKVQPSPLPCALAFRVNDAVRMAGIGRTKLYELARDGRLRLVKIGGRTLVDGASLRALFDGVV